MAEALAIDVNEGKREDLPGAPTAAQYLGREEWSAWGGDPGAVQRLALSAPRAYSDAEVAEMVIYMTKGTPVSDQAVRVNIVLTISVQSSG